MKNTHANKPGVWRLLSVMLAVCMVISLTPAVMAEDIAEGTAPAETVTETVPAETTPTETAPETVPEETTPETVPETIPEETAPESEQVLYIRQLIAELPVEVTEENADYVRARLQEILALYAQLSPAEQEAVDITPCYLLQMQLDEIDSAQTLAGEIVISTDTVISVNRTIASDEKLTVEPGATLTIQAGVTLTADDGKIFNYGTITNSGQITTDNIGIIYNGKNARSPSPTAVR